jgi:hypothetical protein
MNPLQRLSAFLKDTASMPDPAARPAGLIFTGL